MKIYAESEDGKKTEISEITCVDGECNLLLLKMSAMIREGEIENMDKDLSNTIGKTVVCLCPNVIDILGIK